MQLTRRSGRPTDAAATAEILFGPVDLPGDTAVMLMAFGSVAAFGSAAGDTIGISVEAFPTLDTVSKTPPGPARRWGPVALGESTDIAGFAGGGEFIDPAGFAGGVVWMEVEVELELVEVAVAAWMMEVASSVVGSLAVLALKMGVPSEHGGHTQQPLLPLFWLRWTHQQPSRASPMRGLAGDDDRHTVLWSHTVLSGHLCRGWLMVATWC
eukprot:s7214_g2.t1